MTINEFCNLHTGDSVSVRSGLLKIFGTVTDTLPSSSQVQVLIPNIPEGTGDTLHWLSYNQVETTVLV